MRSHLSPGQHLLELAAQLAHGLGLRVQDHLGAEKGVRVELTAPAQVAQIVGSRAEAAKPEHEVRTFESWVQHLCLPGRCVVNRPPAARTPAAQPAHPSTQSARGRIRMCRRMPCERSSA